MNCPYCKGDVGTPCRCMACGKEAVAPVTSMGKWMLYLFLLMLPPFNFVLVIPWARRKTPTPTSAIWREPT